MTFQVVTRGYPLYTLITVPLLAALVSAFFGGVLALNNSRSPIYFEVSVFLFIFWLLFAGLGSRLAVMASKLRNPVMAIVLATIGGLAGYLVHWLCLYYVAGDGQGFLDFIGYRLSHGVIIQTFDRFGDYFTDIGRPVLLAFWLSEAILYFFSIGYGAYYQAGLPFSEEDGTWFDSWFEESKFSL